MTEDDKEDFVSALLDFGVIYDKPVSTQMANIYWKYLKHLDRDGFDWAVKWLMAHHRFFPTPSDFVRGERSRWGS